jgi:transcriptional regulator with XRE-family HTH domain
MGAARDEPPAVARRRVRRELRKARLALGLVQGDVADRLRWSLSKVQRIENGDVGISITDLHALLGVYGVTDETTIQQLTKDAAISRRQRWLVPAEYRQHLTPGLRQLMQFEAEATTIRAYQPFLIPGVVQTPAMAEHVLGWFDKTLSDEDRKVRFDVRMMRAKRIIDDADAPTYLLMLDEGVIGREAGGRAVMADQLEFVAEIARRSNVHIRIVKLAEGASVGMLGAFAVLDLSEDDEDAVIYREAYATDEIDHEPGNVAFYRGKFEDMWRGCYSEADSLRLITSGAAVLRASMIRGA